MCPNPHFIKMGTHNVQTAQGCNFFPYDSLHEIIDISGYCCTLALRYPQSKIWANTIDHHWYVAFPIIHEDQVKHQLQNDTRTVGQRYVNRVDEITSHLVSTYKTIWYATLQNFHNINKNVSGSKFSGTRCMWVHKSIKFVITFRAKIYFLTIILMNYDIFVQFQFHQYFSVI